ncbi:MAG: ParA family protein, partial [Fermentimonas sp.]|jgi:chromosome partitioning protein
LTMYDSRLRLHNQVYEEVRHHFKELVFKTVIKRNVTLSESQSYAQPALMYDAGSNGAINYLQLANELIVKNG